MSSRSSFKLHLHGITAYPKCQGKEREIKTREKYFFMASILVQPIDYFLFVGDLWLKTEQLHTNDYNDKQIII